MCPNIITHCSRLGTECPVEQTTTATLVLSQPSVPSSANQPIRRYNNVYLYLLFFFLFQVQHFIRSVPLSFPVTLNKESMIVPFHSPAHPFILFSWLLVMVFSFVFLSMISSKPCQSDGQHGCDHDSDLIALQRQTKSWNDYQEFLQVCSCFAILFSLSLSLFH